jgi:hypothetical protein
VRENGADDASHAAENKGNGWRTSGILARRIFIGSPLFAGLLLIYAGLGGILLLVYSGITRYANPDIGDILFVLTVVSFVAFTMILGARVIMSEYASLRYAISPEDRKLLEPLIVEANEKAIDQYVHLSSLSGATGAATKLGLTGLPLATVALTVFFSTLAIFQSQPGGFMDLAKLTLGAFIGSFVQRAVSTQAAAQQGAQAAQSEGRAGASQRVGLP